MSRKTILKCDICGARVQENNFRLEMTADGSHYVGIYCILKLYKDLCFKCYVEIFEKLKNILNEIKKNINENSPFNNHLE